MLGLTWPFTHVALNLPYLNSMIRARCFTIEKLLQNATLWRAFHLIFFGYFILCMRNWKYNPVQFFIYRMRLSYKRPLCKWKLSQNEISYSKLSFGFVCKNSLREIGKSRDIDHFSLSEGNKCTLYGRAEVLYNLD